MSLLRLLNNAVLPAHIRYSIKVIIGYRISISLSIMKNYKENYSWYLILYLFYSVQVRNIYTPISIPTNPLSIWIVIMFLCKYGLKKKFVLHVQKQVW